MNQIQKAVLMSQIRPAQPGTVAHSNPADLGGKAGEGSFQSALEGADLRFSKHAVNRLQSRNIEVSDAEKAKLGNALESLEKKGARDSLVLMGELAFIVNVPSKTVVTALSKEQMQEQVFTNIDSTILV